MKLALLRHAISISLLAVPAAVEAKAITYDCDTAANRFSELILPADGIPFTVSGNVKLNALAESATYAPVARVQIATSTMPGEFPDVYAGFALFSLPADTGKTPLGSPAVQMLSYSVSGKEDEVLPRSMMTKLGAIQSFGLSYDGNNVIVNLGDNSKTFPLNITNPVVRLVCSTGEFVFTDLTITSSK